MVQVTVVSLDELVLCEARLFDFNVVEPVLKALEFFFKLIRAFGDPCGCSSVCYSN